MIERIQEWVTCRSTAIASTAGTGGALAHACAHPCAEHFAIAAIVWAIGFGAALRERFGA